MIIVLLLLAAAGVIIFERHQNKRRLRALWEARRLVLPESIFWVAEIQKEDSLLQIILAEQRPMKFLEDTIPAVRGALDLWISDKNPFRSEFESLQKGSPVRFAFREDLSFSAFPKYAG